MPFGRFPPGARRAPRATGECSCCRRPRAVADTVLHGAVHEHLEGFLAEAAARTDGVALPASSSASSARFTRSGQEIRLGDWDGLEPFPS